MGIREALRTRLTSVAGVNNVVAGRIYPKVLPQGPTLPAITFARISKPTLAAHDDSPGGGRLVRARFSFTCWATTADAAEQLGDEVLDALHGLRQTIDGVRIDAVLATGDIEDREASTGRHRRVIDVFVWAIE